MLALCLMLFSTYYAQNYAGIIGTGLVINEVMKLLNDIEVHKYVFNHYTYNIKASLLYDDHVGIFECPVS